MARQPADAPIRQAAAVPVPVGRAFSAFADLVQSWPREYTWAAPTPWRTSGSSPARAATASNGALTASPASGAGSWPGSHPPDPAGTGPPNPLL